MSADSYHQDCECCNGNKGCFSLFMFVVLWSILFWGEPDLIDGIIYWLTK